MFRILVIIFGIGCFQKAKACDSTFRFSDDAIHQFSLGISADTHCLELTIDDFSESEEMFLIIQKYNIDYVKIENHMSGNIFLGGQNVKDAIGFEDDPFFYCRVKSGDSLTLKICSNEQIILPISVWTDSQIDKVTLRRNILSGIFIGILGALFFYNLILYFFLKDENYVYYIFYLLFIGLAQLDIIGFNYYIFSNTPSFSNVLMHYCSGVSGIFGILFIQGILNTRLNAKRGHILLNIIMGVYFVVIVLTLFGQGVLAYLLMQLAGVSLLIILGISFYLSSKGIKEGNYVGASYFVLFVGIVFYVLKDFQILPYNDITAFTLTIGVALQAVLLSVVLANRINVLNRASQMANERAVLETQKNEELILNQNMTLEKKVTKRTAALQEALDDLKAAQSQLVQSEKMASLGTLTAGIAHEINNPINFVSANVLPLRDNINELTGLIQEYKGLNESNYEIELVRLAEVEKEMDLEYTLIETKQLIDGIEEGAKRTHTIVQGLTSFSRGDSGKKSEADINRGIRSTVSVLKSRLNNVNLITNLDKNLPLVSCQVGKINQVVLNLMNNALDALEEKNGTNRKESQLTVETIGLGDSVQIIIGDNANGIEKELQPKIMEPFYTTKPVGKGTGLGLSISYSIIEDHGGAIELDSEEGVGTKFIITLPLVS
jgi:signal transduction histidine kinase